MNWKKQILWAMLPIILPIIVILMMFFMKPHSSEVSEYIQNEPFCKLTKDKDFDDEHDCVYYLRRHSASFFGNIVAVPLPGPFIILPNFFFYIYTPFNYHNEWGDKFEDDTAHTAVMTRDRGGLIFDIPSGKVVGSFEDLKEERKRSMDKQLQRAKKILRELEKEKEQSCDFNKYNCADFKTWQEAKRMFTLCGGINNDVHYLDGDEDGIPCEALLY